jgi:hypothetical protein
LATVAWKETTSRRERLTSAPATRVDVLPQDGVVLLVHADRVRDRIRLAPGVVQHGVEVGDLAEAVAPELERRGHEAESPLAHVERGAPVVVGRGIAIGHHHLGERQPVGHRPRARPVVVAEPVDDEALSVVEPEPHGPPLPREPVAVEHEGSALGLGDLELPEVVAQLLARDEPRDVLAHRPWLVDRELVLDLEQLHRVQVDHEVQPVHRVGVGVGALRAAVPDVGPADAPSAVALGDEPHAVVPHVEQHRVDLDRAPGQGLDHARVAAQGLVALVPLVDGHVRLLTRPVLPGHDALVVEGDDGLVRVPVVAVPHDDDGLPGRGRVG